MKSVQRTLFICGVSSLYIASLFWASTVCLAEGNATASTTVSDTTSTASTGVAVGEAKTKLGNYSLDSAKIIRPKIVNDPPVIGLNPVTFQRQRNSTWKIKISELLTRACVSDPDGDEVSLIGVSSPTTNGGVVIVSSTFIYYTPPATNGNVTDSFTYTVSDEFYATADGMVVLTVPESPPTGQVISIEPTNGIVQITFSGIPGQLYLIQRATNMIEPVYWVTLTNIVADPYGRFGYTDTAPPPGAAFYRAVAP